MKLFEIKRKNRIFYKRNTSSDDTITAVFQNKQYTMVKSSIGSAYYECYIEPTEFGEHLLQILVNDEVKVETIVKVVVVKPENVYKMIKVNK